MPDAGVYTEKIIQISIDSHQGIIFMLTNSGNIYLRSYPVTGISENGGWLPLPTGLTSTSPPTGKENRK